FEQALRAEPDHFWARYFLAVCHLQADRPREALAHLSAALSHRPAFVWIPLLQGYAHGQLEDFAAAEADFRKAVELDPNEYGIYVNRGAMRLRKGDLKEAVDDLKRALELKP